jgi:hypothetical protein
LGGLSCSFSSETSVLKRESDIILGLQIYPESRLHRKENTEGSACVTRRAPQTGQVIDITELSPDDGFGEESLIANGRHNATVSLNLDSSVDRLKC